MERSPLSEVHSSLKSGDLLFKCFRCGSCCCGDGYVFVGKDELSGISEILGLRPAEFREKHLELSRGRRRLNGEYDKPCIFFREGEGCLIYEARPRQCRSFPFWLEHMKDPENFAEIAGFCRGVKELVRIKEKEGRDE